MVTFNSRDFLSAAIKVCILPVLFVFHYIQAYFPFLTFSQVAGFIAIHLAVALILLWLFYFLYRQWEKAALAALLFLGVYFFFSAFHDFIKGVMGEEMLITRYRFLLPVIGIGLTLFVVLLMRSRKISRQFVGYVFTVFLIFILMDFGLIVYKLINPLSSGRITLTEKIDTSPVQCDTCQKPDVYLIIFDEYTSTRVLRENYSYDNSSFDDFFKDQGFNVLARSKGNYYWTVFCLPAMLNMSYLEAVDRKKMKYEDFMSATNLIKHSRVVELFRNQGYKFVNISPFDFVGQKGIMPYAYEEDPVKAMYAHTFFRTVRKDLGWKYIKPDTDTMAMSKFNCKVLEGIENISKTLKEVANTRSEQPRFVYGHIFMPHWPFSFDSTGRRRSVMEMAHDTSTQLQVSAYLNYLGYVNGRLKDLITAVKKGSQGKSVIIAMGDHGYRPESNEQAEPFYFGNFNAVYLPDGMKNKYYDSISGVNQFRVLANSLFDLNMPMAVDSICNWQSAKD